MTTFWLKPTTMKAVIFVCQLFLIIRIQAQNTIPDECILSNTNRAPENDDIQVVCGTEFMELSIFLCPMYNANYNETLMILNGQDIDACKGTPDLNAVPPVLKFTLSIDEQSLAACKNVFRTITQTGTGQYSAFSNVQFINVSGMVVSSDPASGMITYRPSITYLYSCQYPLNYVLNNTQLAVAGVNIAINDNNGSFISTLSMNLYSDPDYIFPLIIPATGLNLKTRIYVEVTATRLTDRFYVLLDRCFATVDEYEDFLTTQRYYDLFVGCDFDEQTRMDENGESQQARFSFEAFRFVMHQNLSVSTFFIHCITRLCNVTMCPSMLPTCDGDEEISRRRRRDTPDENKATVTSPQILVAKELASASSDTKPQAASSEYSSPVVAVIVCVAILSLLLVGMGAYFTWNLRQKLRL